MKSTIIYLFLGISILTGESKCQWITQYNNNSNFLYSLQFIDSNTGWVVGWTGVNSVILKTTNGGINWISQYSGTNAFLGSVHFINNNTGWVNGSNILKTTDGGTSWVSQMVGGSGRYFIQFINSSVGWTGGEDGKMYKTTNGGTNWILQTSFTSTEINSIHFLDLSTGWAALNSVEIYKTTNGGISWQQEIAGSGGIAYLTEIQFVDYNTGYCSGTQGVFKTTNGGANWINKFSNGDSFISLSFINENTGWAAGGGDTIYRTTTGGNSWIRQRSGVLSSSKCIRFINTNTGWIVGGNRIFKTTNGGYSSLFLNLFVAIEGLWNGSTYIDDTLKVYLANSVSPYNIIDSSKNTYRNSGLYQLFSFTQAPLGSYYIVAKHRNSIETWSSTPLNFSGGSNYNFTDARTKAFGNNLKLKNGIYCIYSGDVNQDNIIDASDLSAVENDAGNSLTGYVNSDVTGDNFVDASDLSIVDNNSGVGVSVIQP